MLEGVVVAFFLVTVLYCLMAMAGLYKTKLLVIQDARARNMFNATNNCEPSGRAYAASPPDIGEPAPIIPREVSGFGIDFVRLVQEGGGVSRASSRRYYGYGGSCVPSADETCDGNRIWIGKEVSSHSYTTCNEKPVGLSLDEFVVDSFEKTWDFFAADVLDPLMNR